MANNNNPHIEGSTENVLEPRNIKGIDGLQDVPRSILPVPFYTLVQPESTKAFLPDGKRAPNGMFLMNDSRQVASEILCVIIRAKRQTRIVNKDKVVSLNVLGFNLARKKLFILSVPITSFGAFGAFFEMLEERKATKAWQYAVTLTPEEITDVKDTDEGRKSVTWSVIRLDAEDKPVSDEMIELGQELYLDFAEKLDRNDEDGLDAIAGKVNNK